MNTTQLAFLFTFFTTIIIYFYHQRKDKLENIIQGNNKKPINNNLHNPYK